MLFIAQPTMETKGNRMPGSMPANWSAPGRAAIKSAINLGIRFPPVSYWFYKSAACVRAIITPYSIIILYTFATAGNTGIFLSQDSR